MSKEGNKIRLVNMAQSKVNETNPPKATIPLKPLNLKTENPKNRILEL